MTDDDGARASDEKPIKLGGRKPPPVEQRPVEPEPVREEPPVDDYPNEYNRDYSTRDYEPGEDRFGKYVQPATPPVEAVRLPRNVEAEAALIGAMLIDNRIIERERALLEPRHFFEPVYARIYALMLTQIDADKLVSPVTLRPMLEDDPGLKELGGPSHLAQLTGSGAGLIGAHAFAKQIVELAARRDLYETFRECESLVLDTREEAGIVSAVAKVDDAMSRSMELDRRRAANIGVTIEHAWDETFADMEEVTDTGVTSGLRIDQYEDWNEVVGALDDGDLVYLGGRPSMGKTGVAVKVMMGAAAKMQNEVPPEGELPGAVEFFSLEMSRKPIMQRVIADAIYKPNETSSFDALINGKMTSRDRALIRQMRQQIAGMPLNISDPSEELLVENFASEIRRRQRAWLKKGRRLKLVIVDYLARFSSSGKFSSERDKVTHISKTLKSAAKQCGVALVVLVQLSRGVESRDDKRPMLSDLRDSGSLEQDADVVVFVYRDQYYLERAQPARSDEKKWEAWDLEMQAARDRMELLGAKRRQGALVRRTGYFVTSAQAIRSSEWRYGDDLFSFDGG